jgi:hypothetical protein
MSLELAPAANPVAGDDLPDMAISAGTVPASPYRMAARMAWMAFTASSMPCSPGR